MKVKVVISWILTVVWACVIFIMSSMNTNESNGKSKATINNAITTTVNTTNGLKITNKHPSENKIKNITDKLNQPLRKVAHASEYCIFAIFLSIALKNTGIKGKRVYMIALLICFLYACTDEFHQTFVEGRTGQFTDTLIDTAGGFLGCLIMKIKNSIISER